MYNMQAKKGKISKRERQIIRKVLGKEKASMQSLRKEILISEGVLLALPLLLTFVLYINVILKTTTQVYDVTERLAPSQAEPLLLFMLLFIILYSIFLVFMYKRIKRQLMSELKISHKETKD